MRRILFLTDRRPDEVLPSVLSLGADVKAETLDADGLARVPDLAPDLIVADAGPDPERAFRVLSALRAAGAPPPILCLLTDPASHAWHEVADEVVVAGASEAEARLRIAMLRARAGETGESVVRLGPVAMNVDTYRVSAGSHSLDLTYKEFELLRFLATRPGRVFTRAQLLREVWGYDFYGGTRTVDVHVRRLRSKLGPELEHLIETVRGVGYRAADERGGLTS